jgi:hypothetical protein
MALCVLIRGFKNPPLCRIIARDFLACVQHLLRYQMSLKLMSKGDDDVRSRLVRFST